MKGGKGAQKIKLVKFILKFIFAFIRIIFNLNLHYNFKKIKMRKIKLIITSILFSTIAYAQKGSFYVGGQVGYSTLENKYENNVNQERSNWSFSPEFGTFLNNNIQQLEFRWVRSTNNETLVERNRLHSCPLYGVIEKYFY
jgi:hypothetical protein